MPAFTWGDIIALAAVIVAIGAFFERGIVRWFTSGRQQAVGSALDNREIHALSVKLDGMITEQKATNGKLDAHLLDCASFKARVTAAQESAAASTRAMGKSIASLQSQIRFVPTGSANKMVELRRLPDDKG